MIQSEREDLLYLKKVVKHGLILTQHQMDYSACHRRGMTILQPLLMYTLYEDTSREDICLKMAIWSQSRFRNVISLSKIIQVRPLFGRIKSRSRRMIAWGSEVTRCCEERGSWGVTRENLRGGWSWNSGFCWTK